MVLLFLFLFSSGSGIWRKWFHFFSVFFGPTPFFYRFLQNRFLTVFFQAQTIFFPFSSGPKPFFPHFLQGAPLLSDFVLFSSKLLFLSFHWSWPQTMYEKYSVVFTFSSKNRFLPVFFGAQTVCFPFSCGLPFSFRFLKKTIWKGFRFVSVFLRKWFRFFSVFLRKWQENG